MPAKDLTRRDTNTRREIHERNDVPSQLAPGSTKNYSSSSSSLVMKKRQKDLALGQQQFDSDPLAELDRSVQAAFY
jgi:hypothetical protein